MVSIRCRRCGSVYAKAYARIGMRTRCPYCQNDITIANKDMIRQVK